VAASGSTPLSYQWFKDGVALVGANGATVSIPTGEADAGKRACPNFCVNGSDFS